MAVAFSQNVRSANMTVGCASGKCTIITEFNWRGAQSTARRAAANWAPPQRTAHYRARRCRWRRAASEETRAGRSASPWCYSAGGDWTLERVRAKDEERVGDYFPQRVSPFFSKWT